MPPQRALGPQNYARGRWKGERDLPSRLHGAPRGMGNMADLCDSHNFRHSSVEASLKWVLARQKVGAFAQHHSFVYQDSLIHKMCA